MNGQTLQDSRSLYSGVHSEKSYDSASGRYTYILQLVAFRSAQDNQPRLVSERRFANWDDYQRAYSQTLVMLEQAMSMGR